MSAHPVREVIRLYVEAEPHRYVTEFCRNDADRERALERWCKDFMEFVRDHRSQDLVGLIVQKETQDACSACGRDWEVETVDGEVLTTCCGEPVETGKAVQS